MQKYLGITAFILALAASPALAQNWVGLLKNTPAERFDEEDLRLFLDNARKALNEGQDNQSKGRPCKEVQLHNEAGGRKGEVGPVPERAAVGDGPRGLWSGRQRLGLLAASLLRPRALERAGSHPQGAPVQPSPLTATNAHSRPAIPTRRGATRLSRGLSFHSTKYD